MRSNFPVTGVEYPLADEQSIVSKTDTKGRITYVNPTFIEVSGFTEDELIGKAHNIVRHPDMPEEAFADLWETLKAGLPWTGLVKNRRKNGDHYWVVANVTPVREAGQVVGFMSVRTKPTREQVDAAAELYRKIKDGSAQGIRLRRGAVIKAGWRHRLDVLRHASFDLRLGASMATLIAVFGVGTGLALAEAGHGYQLANAAVGIAITLYTWLSLRSAMVQPLKEATNAAIAIASGDLSTTLDAKRADEMGALLQALQQMNVNLRAIIGDVHMNVESIHAATNDIAAGNVDLSQRTEAQAASLEETASSMEQFASTVQQNADSAVEANQISTSASQVAQKGGAVVEQVGSTMNDISESARRIADIIGLIDSIAFQTNILALNAAVEAARAGEQGKGFAVVASEVRSLAQRSAGAAKEIRTLIGDSVEKVDLGNRLVQDARRTMDEIVSSVGQVNHIMGEISVASREQSSGIAQVNQALAHLDETTQQNAALVEEAANAATSLRDQTERLAQAVSVFKLARRQSLLGTAHVRPASRPHAAPLPRAMPQAKALPARQKNVPKLH